MSAFEKRAEAAANCRVSWRGSSVLQDPTTRQPGASASEATIAPIPGEGFVRR